MAPIFDKGNGIYELVEIGADGARENRLEIVREIVILRVLNQIGSKTNQGLIHDKEIVKSS